MEFSDILYIAGGIALLALAGLFIYLIVFFKETKGLVANASQGLNDLTKQLNTQLENVDGIVKNVSKLTDDLTEVVDDATDIIHEGRNVVISLLELEQTLQRNVQQPIVEITSILSALGKGIRAFRLKLTDKTEKKSATNGVAGQYEPIQELET